MTKVSLPAPCFESLTPTVWGAHMRRLSRVSIVTVFAIALTQMAMAADLPRKAPAYTPPLPPVFSWTGFYVGGNAGWGWLRDSGGTFCINPAGILNGPGCNAQTATSDQIRGDGFICGTQAGYNWQINNWVLGIEAAAAIKGSVAAPIFLVAIPILSAIENAIEKLEWFGTVRGRLGVAFDRVFVYGTGGFAFCIRHKNRLDRRWWHRMGIRRQTVDQDRGSLLRSRFALFSWQRCKRVYGG